ncbi:MAG: OmpA family protein [Bacteroidales bacterium]
MKKITLLISGIVLINFLSAQTLLQKADSVFSKNKDYATSINLYNKALKKATHDQTKYINFQLGECYRNINNYTEAINWYQKAINSGTDTAVVYLHLGEMLIMSGDFANAKSNIEKYISLKPNDNIAKIRLESCNLSMQEQKIKPLFEVKDQTELSSPASDYSISYFKSNKVIISSTRTDKNTKLDPSTMQSNSDLFESTYDPQKNEWSKPSKVKGTINTSFNEGTFSFDSIQKYGYYSQCNGKSGKDKQCNIMYAHYNESTNTWENSKLFDFNSQDFRSQQQAITSDGNTMYFASDMPGGYGGSDLYIIKKVGGVWGKPVNLGATINSIGNEGFPFISGDTLLVFASDGLPGFGGLDIFECSIKGGKISKPVNMMPPINSSADDFGLVFKSSKNAGFFCSNRPGGLGDDDIYSYDLIPVILTASGSVKDKASGKNLDYAMAVFMGSDGSIDSAFTDSKGEYIYSKLKPNVTYSIRVTKDGYLNDSKTLAVGKELYSKTYNKSTGKDLDFTLIKITKEEVKIDNIYYDYDKADIREESKLELNKLVNILKETPDVKLQINSHCDERGEPNYNTELSQRRAQSVVDYLISKGISSDRLFAKGYGFSMPLIKHAKTEEQHQMNRRTTFKILNSSEIGKTRYTYIYPPVNNQVQDSTTTTITTPITTTSNNNVNNSTTSSPIANVTTTTQAVTPVTTTPQVTSPQINTSANIGVITTQNNSTTNSPDNKTVTAPAVHKFFVIAGSYPSKKGAEGAVSLLKTTGFKDAEVVGLSPSGSWRIAFAGYATRAEAMDELAKFRQTNSSAWVFEKK